MLKIIRPYNRYQDTRKPLRADKNGSLVSPSKKALRMYPRPLQPTIVNTLYEQQAEKCISIDLVSLWMILYYCCQCFLKCKNGKTNSLNTIP